MVACPYIIPLRRKTLAFRPRTSGALIGPHRCDFALQRHGKLDPKDAEAVRGPGYDLGARKVSSTSRYFPGSSKAGRWPLFSKKTICAPGMVCAIRHAVSGATFMS